MSRRWTLRTAWKDKLQGQVWVVRNQRGQIGYFKFPTPGQWFYTGPLVANEIIGAALARRVGLPVAQLQVATVKGHDSVWRRGIVSLPIGGRQRVTWRNAGRVVRKHPEQYLHQVALLRGLVVFDAWIANVDRGTGKNLILHRNRRSGKFHWYLIDHANALYGSPFKWKHFGHYRARIWDDVWRISHVPNGMLQLQSSMHALQPMISKIESLRESDIDAAIRQVPQGFLRPRERLFIKRMLLYRQRRLRMMMTKWLHYKGTKESK